MIDISSYRCRIGRFCQVFKCKKSAFINKYDRHYRDKSGYQTLQCLQIIFKLILIIVLLAGGEGSQFNLLGQSAGHVHGLGAGLDAEHDDGHGAGHYAGLLHGQTGTFVNVHDIEVGKQIYKKCIQKVTVNFEARYIHGNIQNQKGIKNFHLNIRSLKNKVSEVKNVVKEHHPHILGLSECELKKVDNKFDEGSLKVPGYDLIFPSSWSLHGYARVVVYIKKTLDYHQVQDLQNEDVQSIWVRAGFKNSKKLFFCHVYREHMSSMEASLRHQRSMLEKFLAQWEEALAHSSTDDDNEVHVSGDMNLDALNNKWLDPSYNLVTLSKQVQSACNTLDFTQLVSLPTRFQYNSVSRNTSVSCIDHVYTNRKFRCSSVAVFPFGGSDHDIIGYTRFTKVPPEPARTIRKRSYKNFVKDDFLQELSNVDWTEVYHCQDVDSAVVAFTRKFVDVLNSHAPWIVYQQRKHYSPWLTRPSR